MFSYKYFLFCKKLTYLAYSLCVGYLTGPAILKVLLWHALCLPCPLCCRSYNFKHDEGARTGMKKGARTFVNKTSLDTVTRIESETCLSRFPP